MENAGYVWRIKVQEKVNKINEVLFNGGHHVFQCFNSHHFAICASTIIVSFIFILNYTNRPNRTLSRARPNTNRENVYTYTTLCVVFGK